MTFSYEDYVRRREPNYGPVLLVYTDGPMVHEPHRRLPMARVERFKNNNDALKRARELARDGTLCNACISDRMEHTIYTANELNSYVG